MEQYLAKIVAITAFRSSAELNNLIPLLKMHCNESEYRSYSMAIATISAGINQEIMKPIFAAHPNLEKEFEATVSKYGRPV